MSNIQGWNAKIETFSSHYLSLVYTLSKVCGLQLSNDKLRSFDEKPVGSFWSWAFVKACGDVRFVCYVCGAGLKGSRGWGWWDSVQMQQDREEVVNGNGVGCIITMLGLYTCSMFNSNVQLKCCAVEISTSPGPCSIVLINWKHISLKLVVALDLSSYMCQSPVHMIQWTEICF